MKDGHEVLLCLHDLESCDICQIDMSLMNKSYRLNHQKVVGKSQKKNVKLELKSKGCANPTCNKKDEDIEKLQYCSKCMTVAYCSRTCQMYSILLLSLLSLLILYH